MRRLTLYTDDGDIDVAVRLETMRSGETTVSVCRLDTGTSAGKKVRYQAIRRLARRLLRRRGPTWVDVEGTATAARMSGSQIRCDPAIPPGVARERVYLDLAIMCLELDGPA